jgi:hypothetical protein
MSLISRDSASEMSETSEPQQLWVALGNFSPVGETAQRNHIVKMEGSQPSGASGAFASIQARQVMN